MHLYHKDHPYFSSAATREDSAEAMPRAKELNSLVRLPTVLGLWGPFDGDQNNDSVGDIIVVVVYEQRERRAVRLRPCRATTPCIVTRTPVCIISQIMR